MGRLIVLLAALVLPAMACAAPTATVLDYGVYAVEPSGDRRPSENDPTGYQETFLASAHKETTDTICARLKLTFGLRYRLDDGRRQGAIPVTSVVHFPAPGLTNTKQVLFPKAEYKDVAVLGEASWFFYSFDEPWEMVAGIWVIAVRLDGKTVLERSFTVSTSCGIS